MWTVVKKILDILFRRQGVAVPTVPDVPSTSKPSEPVVVPLTPALTPAPAESIDPMTRFIRALPVLTQQGWDAMTVITHAWHESGGFRHIIGQNNFFGITLPQGWTGLVRDIITHEFSRSPGDHNKPNDCARAITAAKKEWPNGTEFTITNANVASTIDVTGTIYVKVKVVRKFADWVTAAEAMAWYGEKIKRMYPQSFSFRNVPDKYFYWLVHGKYQYATNPQYVDDNVALYKVVANAPQVAALLKSTNEGLA